MARLKQYPPPTVWDGISDAPCPACGGEHHRWDCEVYGLQEHERWAATRGAAGHWPRLWACSGCGYSFWSYGVEQDPDGDSHCRAGRWLADRRAVWEAP